MADEVINDGDVKEPVVPGDNQPAEKPAVPAQVTPEQKVEADRNRGILEDLKRERKARQDSESRYTAIKAQHEQAERRIRALAGVDTPSAEEADAEVVRKQFAKFFPQLAGLTAEDIQALQDLKNQAAGIQEATTHHYTLHGRRMLDSVTGAIQKNIGGTLTARQVARIERAYVQEAESNPEFLARHDAGDPKVVEEFVKDYIEDFFEPARRKVLQTEVDRQRRVPSGRDRSVAGIGGKKIDFNDPKAVEQALVDSFKAHGGAFGE